MAGSCGVLLNAFRRLTIAPYKPISIVKNEFLQLNTPLNQIIRNTSFFNKLPAEHLWKGVTSVSNAGSKKGRGKGVGKKRSKDLNKGQVIGCGKTNILWPGLSAPILRGNELVTQQKLPEDPEREAKLVKLRDSMKGFRRLKLSPIERGWSGAKMPGRSLGPPDPVGENSFDGFETKCLEFKTLLCMTGNLGRQRKLSAMVITGNGKGLAGFAIGKSREGSAALRKARNRAGQRLMHFKLYNNHTIFHDFYAQFFKTKLFVSKKPEGYGLVCHRAIKEVCQVIGIKDLHAKVEGSHNLQNIVKAFLIGLLKQKSHQQIAEEKELHLVEFRRENEYFPKVVASPQKVRSPEEIPTSEVLDFTQYALGNRIVLKKKKPLPFYTKKPHWKIYLKKYEKRRNHDKIKLDHLVEKGEIKSFLNEKYPDVKVEA